MNWWNKNKKILIPVFVGLIFLSVVVAAAILAGPMIGCTMMGCMGGLDITLTGSPASDYQIKVIYPSGETRSLTCGLGAAETRQHSKRAVHRMAHSFVWITIPSRQRMLPSL
jgi:hypothetical protein